MEAMEVISRVEEPTEWCAGMVVVPKPKGKVRICVDLTQLNPSVCRERHPLPVVEQTLAQIAGAQVFSKLDANSGFWQIPLAKESYLLTTLLRSDGTNSTVYLLASAQLQSTSSVGWLISLEGWKGSYVLLTMSSSTVEHRRNTMSD